MMRRNFMLPFLFLSLLSCCATTGGVHLATDVLEGPVLEVHFLDVGEGDSMYVRTPGGKHYLIDTGERGARKFIIPYLKAHGVTHLDGVLITHGHLDHIGSALLHRSRVSHRRRILLRAHADQRPQSQDA